MILYGTPHILFSEFLHEKVGKNWVLHRRTARIVERYGKDVVCLSQRQYRDLEAQYERMTLRSASGSGPCKALVDAAPELLAALDEIAALAVINRDPAVVLPMIGMEARAAIAKVRG
jgi:hypothetical protein